MGLRAIFDAIDDVLPDEVRVHGPDEKAHHSRPPRITWEPMSGTHGPPKGIGGGATDDGDLWTRRVSVEVKVWGEDFEKTEELLGLFVAKCHDQLTQHSYQLAGERWIVGGDSAHGSCCVLTLVLNVPILRTRTGTVRLSQVTIVPDVKP